MNYLFIWIECSLRKKTNNKGWKELRKYLEMKITGIICKNYNIPGGIG